jgi:hypothetical protein
MGSDIEKARKRICEALSVHVVGRAHFVAVGHQLLVGWGTSVRNCPRCFTASLDFYDLMNLGHSAFDNHSQI